MVIIISLVLVTCLITDSVLTEAHSIIFPDDDKESNRNCVHQWKDKIQVCSENQYCQGQRINCTSNCYDQCGDQGSCYSLNVAEQIFDPYRDHTAQLLVGELLENKKEINWKCGGSLIAPRFVLTSAHCLPLDDDVTYVRITRMSPRGRIIEHKYVFAEKTFIHPKFHYKTPFYYDLAILQLQESVYSFKPIFLPTQDSSYKFQNQSMHLFGWAKHGNNYNFTHNTMEIVNNRKCASYFRLPDLRHGITITHICGEMPNEGSLAPCSGAKLGPLQTDDHVIVGIPSFTFGCNNERPLVFTNIVFFTPWIRSTLQDAWVDHCGFPQRR
ncbi:testisin-like [Lutzomyia longipalpis]|uniref:testisin-like n=1 Tax=Lutzomyia longipalpis TaxID=7200 RepID=UPI002484525A|nr:testisin-like [Lutzomyia longipalpis]